MGVEERGGEGKGGGSIEVMGVVRKQTAGAGWGGGGSVGGGEKGGGVCVA